MKKPQIFRITLAFIVLGLAFSACEEEREYDELYYVENSTVSSSDPDFTDYDGEKIIHFSISGGEVTLNVNCGTKWYADNSNPNIFAVTVTSKSLTITAYKNLVGEELTGTITLRTVESDIKFATITVIQDGPAYINLGDEELLVSKFEGATSVSVKSNFDWNYSYDTSNGWLTIDKDEEGSSLIITYKENEIGSDREEVVAVTAGDGAANSTKVELKITQSCEDIDILILEYTITSSSTVTIKLPIYDVTDATIDWGDGATETTSTNNPSHRYDYPGVYDVSVSGTVRRLTSYSSGSIAGTEYLTAVKQWGNTGLTSMYDAFYKCSNLTSFPDEAGSFSNVTTFEGAFHGCSALTEIPQKIFSKCTMTTDFRLCFVDCTSLISIPENLFSNCASATDFRSCFLDCTSLISIPENMFSNCASATDFRSCFLDCTSLISIPENLFSDCISAKDFSSCFSQCYSLVVAPSFTGCTAAEDFSYCFSNCKSLTTIPNNIFLDCTNATNFYGCFWTCSALASVPENTFSNCTAVTDFSYCFCNCESLIYAPSFAGHSKVTTFGLTFDHCESLTAVPENIFSGCTAVKDFSRCFCHCKSLTTIPDNIFLDCANATNFYGCFWTCSALASVPENTFSNCTAVTDFSNCFSNCESLTTVPENIFSGCTVVKDFSYCFSYCSSLTALPEDLFSDCTAVTDFLETFYECIALKDVPISLFDNNLSATDFCNTFYGCCSVVGESPYIEITVDGERVKVHLYNRSKYTSNLLCKGPTSYSGCFYRSSFSDIDSIPSSWK